MGAVTGVLVAVLRLKTITTPNIFKWTLEPETRDVGHVSETCCLVYVLHRCCRIGEVSRGGLNISCRSRIGPFKVDIIAKIRWNSSLKWFHAASPSISTLDSLKETENGRNVGWFLSYT